MRRSYIADEIVAEYNKKQHWKYKARQNCMETTCDLCRYKYICDEVKDEILNNNSKL